jgi:hypothetical protein
MYSSTHSQPWHYRSGRFTPVIFEYEAGCGHCGEEIIYFPYQDSSTGPSSLKPSHYTDYATLVSPFILLEGKHILQLGQEY